MTHTARPRNPLRASLRHSLRKAPAALLLGLSLLLAPGPVRVRSAPAASALGCAPLPPATGTVANVSTVAELQAAVASLASGTTILIADGTYDLTSTLVIGGGLQDVALRGASGNREAVVLRGMGMSNANYGSVPHGILIQDADDVLVADLTIRDAYFHLIQIQGEQGAQRPRLFNLHLLDSGEQFVKVSTAGPPGPYADDGVVACSLIEYTDRARSDYTNGVDVLAGAGWIIRDNVFRNIRAPAGQLAGPAVLMWRNSLDSVVERNQFIECDRAIALGLSAPDPLYARDGETVYDHQGGFIRNNFIYRAGAGDVGITVNYARDYAIEHNTVFLNDTFFWAIEYRFSASTGALAYNLADGDILQRDGAQGTLLGNLTNAQSSWFADTASGDLHLTAAALAAIDQAAPLASVMDDYDGDLRPIGPAPDVGAAEYGLPPPAAVLDLRVTNALADSGVLTATLGWMAPAGALTTTVRYSGAHITEASWPGLAILADGLPGSATAVTGSLPYAGGPVYFALKTQNAEGAWSALSNNAFWPRWDAYLSFVRR